MTFRYVIVGALVVSLGASVAWGVSERSDRVRGAEAAAAQVEAWEQDREKLESTLAAEREKVAALMSEKQEAENEARRLQGELRRARNSRQRALGFITRGLDAGAFMGAEALDMLKELRGFRGCPP